MGDGQPKYLNSPETPIFDKSRTLYGLNYARTSRKPYFLLCEGYMDVIALHQAGFTNTVASLGTSLTELQAGIIKRYVNEVMITYDSDGAGVKAAIRAIPMLKAVGITTKVVNMKPYKDPDEFIKAVGAEEYQKRIDQADNSFFFEITMLERDFDMNDPEEKTRFFQETAKRLLVFPEELERNNYIEALARRYAIRADDLKKMVNRFGARLGTGAEYEKNTAGKQERREKRQTKTPEEGLVESQKLLLTFLADAPYLIPRVAPLIAPEDFTDPVYRTAAGLLYQAAEKKEEVNPARLISHFEEKEEQSKAEGIFMAERQEEMSGAAQEKALNEAVLRIRRNSLEEKSRTMTDMAELQQVVIDLRDLQKLHISLAKDGAQNG